MGSCTAHGELLVFFVRTSNMQHRAFSVVDPTVWNGLELRFLPRDSSDKFNFSLRDGSFLPAYAPVFKKPSFDTGDLSNYRPISTFNFTSKILEWLVIEWVVRMGSYESYAIHLSVDLLIFLFQSLHCNFTQRNQHFLLFIMASYAPSIRVRQQLVLVLLE